MNPKKPAVHATELAERTGTIYPAAFASRVQGRSKRALGDYFGIQKFGINRTELAPGASSSLLHRHSKQEEFIYILEGRPTLVLENEEVELAPGMCAGFTPNGSAHQLVNRTQEKVVYLEMGDRAQGDQAEYPCDDLAAKMGDDGKWQITHKDGRPY